MRRLALFTALLLSLPCFAQAADAIAPVQSVAQVELPRYLGRWYEIARYPMYFQRQCVGDVTALYAMRQDGRISVTNRCRTADGKLDVADGVATAVSGSGNAQLKVSFFWPFKADYWVIGLDPQYRWAVVGNPSRKNLWVLARTPRLPEELLAAALASAQAQGFDLKPLQYTPQTP
ncbi:lipocalin family protein [Chitiniphilus eburneus]|uniref:Outer membrane lipoprotein Blc n=1 Tax=Chitiniphilus eburneus TaxID=2571148 RepID=A0A4V5MR23_9NEIS|nr:lipocalin family protein [Chitiniphilus eburneus]TJZ74788.1 hypothetical protein FAZ21_07390 [Chitiniphilus eburneus]